VCVCECVCVRCACECVWENVCVWVCVCVVCVCMVCVSVCGLCEWVCVRVGCVFVWVCVCVCVWVSSLSYTACNANAPYCHLWRASFYIIFPHFLISGKIFEKKVSENKMCVLIPLRLLSETFLIIRRSERDMIENVYRSSWKSKVICTLHVYWVPVTTAWRVLRLRIEERPPVRRVAANILNKQSWTADKGWSSSLGFGRGANNPSL